jgi:hypothetical protein
MTIRRHTAMSSALLLVLALAGPAAADTREIFTFADEFDGSFECEGFDGYYEGHDRGRVTDFFDGDGVPYRQVGHIHAIETDYNLETGKSVVVRTNLTVRGVLSPDGELTSHSISGEFNIGNARAEGIVIHDAGLAVIDADGMAEVLRGIHDTFTKGEQAFCDALD